MTYKLNSKIGIKILAFALIALFLGTIGMSLFVFTKKQPVVSQLAEIETEDKLNLEEPVALTMGLKWDNGELVSAEEQMVVSAASNATDDLDAPSANNADNVIFSFTNASGVEIKNGSDAYTMKTIMNYFSTGGGKDTLKGDMKLKFYNDTRMSFTKDKLDLQESYIHILDSSDNIMYKIGLKVRMGWCIVGFQAGYNSSSGFIPVGGSSITIAGKTRNNYIAPIGDTASSFTEYLKKLDPNYSGTIQIKVWVSSIKYKLDLYYKTGYSDGKSTYGKIEQEYKNTTDYVTLPSSLDSTKVPSGYKFVCWAFKTTAANNQEDGVTNETYKDNTYPNTTYWTEHGKEVLIHAKTSDCTRVGKQISLQYSDKVENGWTTGVGAPYTYYKITGVKGVGLLTQNSAGTYGPIIEALFEKTPTQQRITIDNSSTYWSDYTEESYKDDLYGAYSLEEVNSGNDGNFAKTTVNLIATDSGYEFYQTKERSFYHGTAEFSITSGPDDDLERPDSDCAKRGYLVYNYGHYVSGYQIKVGGVYLKLADGKFKNDGTTPVTITLANLKNAGLTLASVIEYVDGKVVPGKNYPEVTIYPVWTAANIKVKNGSNDVISENFGCKYSDLPTGLAAVGKTAYARKIGDQIISLDGVWNYAKINKTSYTANRTESFSGTTHTTPRYTINLGDVQYVNNIYKVQLSDVPYTFKSNKYAYKIASDNKTFANDLNEDVINYKTSISGEYGACPNYNNEKYIDSYISTLNTKVADFTSKIDDNADDNFSIFNNVYYAFGTKSADLKTLEHSSKISPWIYLAYNYQFSDIVSFYNEYQTTIFWRESSSHNPDSSVCAYKSTELTKVFNSEIGGFKQQTNWLVDGGVLYSHNKHNIDLYYSTLGSSGYSKITASPYAITYVLDVRDFFPGEISQENDKFVRTFDGWYFDLTQAQADGYVVDIGTSELNVTGNNVDLTFAYSGKNVESDKYYLTTVNGYGAFIQNDSAPIIKARWGNKYDAEIDNSGTYNANFPVYWQETSSETLNTNALYGAFYGEGENVEQAGVKKVNFTFNNASKLGFYSGDGHAFIKDDGTGSSKSYATTGDGAFYRVFNYGHEVSGWAVAVDIDGTKHWITYNSGFGNGSEPDYIRINNLFRKDLSSLANYLDNIFVDIKTAVKITLIPKWEAVDIKMSYKDSKGTTFNNTITYADSYVFNTSGFVSSVGQSLISFSFSNGDLVSLDGVWNYTKNEDKYGYGGSLYTLTLTPIYVDNIYKIKLDNIYKQARTSKNIILDTVNSDFVFETIANAQNFSQVKYTYLTYSGYTFVNYTNYDGDKDFVEYYIEQGLKELKAEWENSIANSSFELFGHIYYTITGVYSADDRVLTQTTTSNSLYSNIDMWIYLADNQQYKRLPIFVNDYSKTIAWKTTEEYGADNTYAYSTEALSDVESQGVDFFKQISSNEDMTKWQITVSTSSEPTEAISLYSASAYKTDLYYEDSYSSDGVYLAEKSDWYLLDTHDELYTMIDGKLVADQIPEDLPNNKIFGNWVFNRQIAEDEFGVASVSEIGTMTDGNGIIKLEHNDGYIILVVSGFVDYHQRTADFAGVYYVTEIGGVGIFEQDKDEPILFARLKTIYDVTLDNSYSEAWSGFSNSILPQNEKAKLYGAKAYTVQNPVEIEEIETNKNITDVNSFASVMFKVADTGNYAYKFMTSITNEEPTVFYHFDDMEGLKDNNISALPHSNCGYYYVYNYGYYISGWEISFTFTEHGTSKTLWLVKNGDTWTTSDSKVYSEIQQFNSSTFEDFANQIDSYNMLKLGTPVTAVTIKPIWSAVDVQVTLNGGNLLTSNGVADDREFTIKFNSDYEINTSHISVPVGKSLMAFIYDGTTEAPNLDTLIALPLDGNKIQWNYSKIPYDKYIKNTSISGICDYGEFVYNLSVQPLYVDNIYKVMLQDVISKRSETYELISTDYTINDTYGSFKIDDKNKYTYLDSIDSYSFVEYSKASYSLVDNYISTLKTTRDSFVNGLAGGFSLFEKVYYPIGWQKNGAQIIRTEGYENSAEFHIYLANGQSMSKLPMFDNEYAKTIAWRTTEMYRGKYTYAYATLGFNEDEIGNLDNFKNEIVEDANNMLLVGEIWQVGHLWMSEQEEAVLLYSTSVYRTDLYYEDNNSSDGIYSALKSDWYLLNNSDSLYHDNVADQLVPDFVKESQVRKTFDKWLFNESMMQRNYSYTIDTQKTSVNNDGEGVITINHSNGTLVLETSGYVKYHTPEDHAKDNKMDILYYITAIGGLGIFEQNDNYPILVAKLSIVYEVTLDNSYSQAWSHFDDSILSQDEKAKLYGAKAYTVEEPLNDIRNIKQQENTAKQTRFDNVTFMVANAETYRYRFMTSMIGDDLTTTLVTEDSYSVTFFHYDDMEGINLGCLPFSKHGYYYVYNYGHYISGWKIILTGGGKYLTKNSGVWDISNSETIIEINQLIGDSFSSFAEFAEEADYKYAITTGCPAITIQPVWTAVNVCAETEEKDLFNSSIKTFGLDYEFLSNVVTEPSGKKLIAYYYDENSEGTSLIAKNGIWNYANIPHDVYSRSGGDTLGDGIYTISLIPIFVDNIYKINLNNVTQNMDGNYQLDNTDFIYNSRAGNYYTNNDYHVLTFENSFNYGGETYTFIDHSASYSLMDKYIDVLSGLLSTYRNGIDGLNNDNFDIFKKVYYSNGTVTSDKLTLVPSGTTNLSIYLANEQLTGALPVFKNDYYLLIFWENNEIDTDSNQFAYVTNEYDETETDHVAELEEFETHKDGDMFTYIWYFKDGDVTTTPDSFNAHYYRKSYFVNISTKVLETIERRGYVILDVQDKLHELDSNILDRSGKYLFISENITGQYLMKVYKLRQEINLSEFKLNSLDDLMEVELANTSIRVYAGCDVEMIIFDQSQDPVSMNTGNFDEMIGYRYKDIAQSANEPAPSGAEEEPLFSDYDANNPEYSYFVTANEIALKDYKNKTQISIDVFFTQIEYDLEVYLQYLQSGGFTLQKNNLGYTTLQRNTSVAPYKQEKSIVTDKLDIFYHSYAGYTLNESMAFQFYYDTRNSHVLQTYDDSEADGNGYNQTHTILLSGTWLRQNYYGLYQPNYPIWPSGKDLATDLGDVAINADVIEFNYGVKIRDYIDNNDLNLGKIIFDDSSHNTTFALNINTGENNTVPIASYLEEYTLICPGMLIYAYNYVDGEGLLQTSYKTILTSRMFFTNILDHDSTEDNHFTKYDFPIVNLQSVAYDGFVLKSVNLAQMVNNYSDGSIIDYDDRNIYILLDTSTIKEISLVQYADNAGHASNEYQHDSMLSDKSVGITLEHNGENVSASQIGGLSYPFKALVKANAEIDETSGLQIMEKGSPWATTQAYEYKFMTYLGMKIKFNPEFNEKHYLSASVSSYYEVEDGGKVVTEWTDENRITLSSLDGFEARWEPKPLNVEYVYKINGEIKTLEELSSYIEENETYKQSTEKNFYMCDLCNAVTYEVTCLDSSYNIELSINDVLKGQTTNAKRTLSLFGANSYLISAKDYEFGKVQIVVNLVEKSSGNLSVGFRLKNNAFGGEEFGTYDVIVNSVSIINGASERTVLSVTDGAQVKIKLNLTTGYKFVSYQQNTLSSVNATLDTDNQFVMISSYDIAYHETNGTNYYIDLEKIEVMANIDKGDAVADYFINGSTSSTKVYVLSSVNFTTNQVSAERLKHYYYLENGTDRKIYLTNDGTENGSAMTSLIITSEMLNTCATFDGNRFNITFYVEHINKYQFNVSVETGNEYLKSGYPAILEGENPVVSGNYHDEGTELTLQAEAVLEDKYNITVSINGSVFVAFTNNMEFTMTEDKNVVLKVERKIFSVGVKEYYLTTLEQVENKSDQTELNSNKVNDLTSTGQAYDETAKLTFVADIKSNRRLSSIIITHDGEVMQEIELDSYYTSTGLDIMGLNSYLKAIGCGDFTFEVESIQGETTTLSLRYKTKGNISIEMYYKQYKIIEA